MRKATHKQTFIGIWFRDKELLVDHGKMKFYLDQTFYYYRIFVVEEDFFEYLKQKLLVAKVFLIISVSNSTSDSLTELTRDYSEKFEKVYNFLPKNTIAPANSTFNNIDHLFEQISNDINEKMNPLDRAENILYTEPKPTSTTHVDKDLPELSVFNSKLTQITRIRHLTKESLKFVSYLTMRDILIRESYKKDELIEMWASSRDLHHDNDAALKNIDRLQMNYDEDQVIQYYKKSSFLFRTVNQVCGTDNMENIYKFRIYINHLHNKLCQLDKELGQNELKSCIKDKKLYRGNALTGSVLQQLIDNEGGWISMNGFLSTTTDLKVAKTFAAYKAYKDPGMKSTLFVLKIHEKMSQPYAYIFTDGALSQESEFLFSLGTMWCIESVTNNKDLCTIELSCKELDPKLDRLIKEYTGENATFMSLGDISHELGNESEAEWCYRKMLDQQPNNNVNTGILHYKIGKIQFEKKLYPEAFKNLIQAKSFFRQSEMKLNATTSLESTQRRYTELSLLKIYNDIGVMLEKKGKLKEAADRYEHALEEKSSDTDRAVAYRNFGHLHFRLGNYIKAKEHYEEARRLLDINHIWSQKFSSGLKRIIDYLAYNPDNEEHKRKKQKTNS